MYRRDQPNVQLGRFREFYQCDFDIAGNYGTRWSYLLDLETYVKGSSLPCLLRDFQHAKALYTNLVLCHNMFLGGGVVVVLFRAHGAGRGGAERGLRDPELASYRKLPDQAQPPQVGTVY